MQEDKSTTAKFYNFQTGLQKNYIHYKTPKMIAYELNVLRVLVYCLIAKMAISSEISLYVQDTVINSI